ncbi:alpha/beta fold hydrolase [Adhaeribacter pallidiroseus]|uniref:Chloride peroxidase n=1 Tax=Adhaeribacter pallidiroseus TaxID=2072847 RepID=A0A369QMN6_9BACT|nr:alpha/beta hydrolase [Adhaeribacter pallidiroseus]RDC64915.1 Chloride peroxidase [Adhaeribacter pallidiroseus]
MNFILNKNVSTGEEIKIAYADYGSGRPVVLIHGWPLSKDMWEYQVGPLVESGHRVIQYDRRGFGHSEKPWSGYDYDSLTSDLHALIEELDLNDAVLVGFSMGGGEVVRYLSRYGSSRVSKIVLVSAVTPYLGKTEDNPDGVDQSVFAEMLTQIKEDRIGFLDSFGKKFFGVNLINHPVSAPLLDYYRMLASVASPRATEQCAIAFAQTDFRQDVQAISVPTLIIHGDADQTVPIEASGNRTASMIPAAQYLVYEGAPHGLFYTHKERLNQDILQFIAS